MKKKLQTTLSNGEFSRAYIYFSINSRWQIRQFRVAAITNMRGRARGKLSRYGQSVYSMFIGFVCGGVWQHCAASRNIVAGRYLIESSNSSLPGRTAPLPITTIILIIIISGGVLWTAWQKPIAVGSPGPRPSWRDGGSYRYGLSGRIWSCNSDTVFHRFSLCVVDFHEIFMFGNRGNRSYGRFYTVEDCTWVSILK